MTPIDLITGYSLRKIPVMMKMYSSHTSETDSIQDFQSHKTTKCVKQQMLKVLIYSFIIVKFYCVNRDEVCRI